MFLGIATTLLPAVAPVLADKQPTPCAVSATSAPKEQTMATHSYVGMWVTDDGHIRHELLPNGRYDEARGQRQSAYQGRYEITGTHIEYWDDTGFTADGDFVDENTLHHAGMIFRRR
ncbi:Atu4866 domain-containing protein [Steroidobacter gossypii]